MKKIAIIVIIAFLIFNTVGAFCAPAAPEQKQQQILPRKIAVDSNYDGKADRTEYYNEKGEITKVETDQNGDGIADETVLYENGKPAKGSKDLNKDGKPDVWIDF